MEGLEVLPGQLIWAPELSRLPAGKDGVLVNAIEIADRPKYYVQHYSTAALSHAFGPFALDQILVFCRQLKILLISHGSARVYLTSKKDDAEEHTNACVLLGAYLVLVHGWSTSQIVKVLGKKEADRAFTCSWQTYGKVMTVIACWEALEVAERHDWICRHCLDDDVFTDFACSKYRNMIATFDASWIVPGKLMVAADPVTTFHDPNPETFQRFWSTEKGSSHYTHEALLPNRRVAQKPAEHDRYRKIKYSNVSGEDNDCPEGNRFEDDANTDSTENPQCLMTTPHITESADFTKEIVSIDGASSTETVFKECQRPLSSKEKDQPEKSLSDNLKALCGDSDCPEGNGLMTTTARTTESIEFGKEVVSNDGASSTETVCKQYQLPPVSSNEKEQPQKSFSDFLQDSKVELMVRCNYLHEPGMPKMTYSVDKLKQYGVEHQDIQFVDKQGGLPAPCHVAAMLKAGAPVLEDDAGAVLVHCKGGFGRSIVLACCLAIHTYDIPGRALLGWVRISRPGAITNGLQERFLISLQGRTDVARFAGTLQPAVNQDVAWVGCRTGCMVQ